MGYLREALGVGIDSATTPQEQGRQFEVVLRQALRVHPSEWGKSTIRGCLVVAGLASAQ